MNAQCCGTYVYALDSINFQCSSRNYSQHLGLARDPSRCRGNLYPRTPGKWVWGTETTERIFFFSYRARGGLLLSVSSILFRQKAWEGWKLREEPTANLPSEPMNSFPHFDEVLHTYPLQTSPRFKPTTTLHTLGISGIAIQPQNVE